MTIVEKVMEMRGMPRSELVKYFISIGGNSKGDGIYVGGDWQVEVGNEEICRLGSVVLPSTKIKLSINEEKFNEFINAFRLKFLSAGG